MTNESQQTNPTIEKLPPVPSGYEALDMAWRDLAALAGQLIVDWGGEGDFSGVDPEAGAAALFCTWQSYVPAAEMLARTRRSSVLWLSRSRAARALWQRFTNQANDVFCALLLSVQRDHPTARPEQVFLLARDRLREVLRDAINETALEDSD